jgi:hypothetical protein
MPGPSRLRLADWLLWTRLDGRHLARISSSAGITRVRSSEAARAQADDEVSAYPWCPRPLKRRTTSSISLS